MDIIGILSFCKDGNLEAGFNSVKLEIRDSKGDTITKKEAALPSARQLAEQHKRWSLCVSQGIRFLPDNLRSASMREIKAKKIYSSSEHIKTVKQSSVLLETEINKWLSSEEFQPITYSLLHHCNYNQSAKLIIETEDLELQRLPWHLWNCSQEYINFVEVAISPTQYTKVIIKDKNLRKQIRILGVFGDTRNINVDEEKKALKEIDDTAKVEFIEEPSKQELKQHLADKKGWDILLFAGHSNSQADGTDGELSLNQKDSIQVSEINQLLKDAVSRGLTLAIFNSCDGIGIANSMANLNIPYVIVMREPVPDRVAQDFFKQLIFEFYQNQQCLSVAVNRARKYLHTLENEYPCASYLPLLFHNVSAKPLTRDKLLGFTKNPPPQIDLTHKLTDTGRNISDIALPQDCINIAFIGDQASGKTTYIASLIHNPHPPESSIINRIYDLNDKAKTLRKSVEKRIEKGKTLESNDSSNFVKICDYRLKMKLKNYPSLWERFFSSESQFDELVFNLRDFNGRLFSSIGQYEEENCLIQDSPELWTQSTGIVLTIAEIEKKEIHNYEQKIKKILSILNQDQSERKCQRIAVVFTKCDRDEMFSSRQKFKTPQALAEENYRQVHNLLKRWQEGSNGEFEYFYASAFGFSGQFKQTANAKHIYLNQYVLKNVQCWQPVNLLPPIYWLATGIKFLEVA